VRDGLALAGMLGAVAGVEETAADGDEGVVVLAVAGQLLRMLSKRVVLPLQHTIAVAVDYGYRFCVCDTDMVWLDPNHLAILLVRIVYGKIAVSFAGLEEQPEICKGCREWSRDVLDLPIANVWQDVVENRHK
jgi:hypothetical protein